ncbi:MAG: PatB family C-S lyase [Bacteroidales bacterium]|nr:PatB family C-S lyase [Bacteroidales bacterium]
MPSQKYDFDTVINCRNTASVKHDMMYRIFGRNDLLPMWVAEMDFATPDFILNAIRLRLQHPMIGYTFGDAGYFSAVIAWLKKRYHINAQAKELHYIPGIVAGISFFVQAFTDTGDAIVICPPVYPPFIQVPLQGKRELRCSHLQETDGKFYINWEDFEQKLQGAKLFILSNPHNPGGRVWTREELQRIAALCHKHHVTVISDEIHADLVFNEKEQISFSTVSPEARKISATFIAPSKTFNVAGMASSIVYIPDNTVREQYWQYLDGYEVANGHTLAYTTAIAAFTYGEEWLHQVKTYIQSNIDFTIQYMQKHLPLLKVMRPQASYLMWLDFSAMQLSHQELKNRLINRALIALNDGTEFGGDLYQNCFRINVACPRTTLIDALERICSIF